MEIQNVENPGYSLVIRDKIIFQEWLSIKMEENMIIGIMMNYEKNYVLPQAAKKEMDI